mgnify:CR=1 FL=1
MIIINNWINKKIMKPLGGARLNFSKTIKSYVKTAVQYLGNFEELAAETAQKNGYKYVACGHIHSPKIKTFNVNGEDITYSRINLISTIKQLTPKEEKDLAYVLSQEGAISKLAGY